MNENGDKFEKRVRKFGLMCTLATLLTLLWGVWRGTQRAVGRKIGREPGMMRTQAFYILASGGYFALCYRLWRPLPLTLSRPVRALSLWLGSLLYLTGLAFVLWGRLALGQMYNVSSSLGAQLYADHRLVAHGPFALVRHPMYLGVLFVGAGGLSLYRTWTFVFVLLHFPVLVNRARREEQALAAEFGPQWEVYQQRVPPWWPYFGPQR